MLKPGMRVIEAQGHIGCHPLPLDRVCFQPPLAGVKGVAVPSDLERFDLPLIPVLFHGFRRVGACLPNLPRCEASLGQKHLRLTDCDGTAPARWPYGPAAALSNPHHGMLMGPQLIDFLPIITLSMSILLIHPGYMSLGVAEPRFASDAGRFRLVGCQSGRSADVLDAPTIGQ
jgi:hypothetical protein